MRWRRFSFISLGIAIVIASVSPVGSAIAQPYVGFYLSGTPATDQEIEADRTITATGATASFDTDDVRFGSSVVVGGVVGYRFLSFLAGEINVFHFSPTVREQTRIARSSTAGDVAVTIEGGDVDVTGLAIGPVASYSLLPDESVPDGRLELYVGGGLVVFFTRVDTTARSPFANFSIHDDDTSVGPHAKAGGRWFFTENLAGFVELHYGHLDMEVEGKGTIPFGGPIMVRATNDVDLVFVAVGASWHFR